MKKITLLLLLVSAITFAQDVLPTFSWTNKSTYQKGGETNVTFKPGDVVSINFAFTLGQTAGTANTKWYVQVALQSSSTVTTDPISLGPWALVPVGTTAPIGSGNQYPATTTLNYTIPAETTLSSSFSGTYRLLFYLAYYAGGDTSKPIYGGANGVGSDSNIVKIRNASEIAALGTASFNKNTISFYPNPAKDIVTFGKDVESKSYKVLSMTGALIKEVPATGTLNVSDLASGTYILSTDAGTAKIIKE